MTKKIIPFDLRIKSSEVTSYSFGPKAKVYTNDLNAVELHFKVTDTSDSEMSGSTASVLLFMRDGSFFQSTDVTRLGNLFTYAMKPNQIKHRGIAQVQLVVKKGTIENASPLLEFEIVGGLETKPITEVMIQDWTSLTAEAKAFVDQIEGFTLDQFVENKMGEELANIEVNYATRLTGLEANDQSIAEQLAQTDSKITASPLQKKLLEKMSGSLRKVNFPSGWEWTNAPINIFKDFNGGVFTDFEASDFKPHLTGTTYYVAINGSDSNDGLTPDKPFRKIMTAMNMPDRAKIIVGGGVYDRLNAFGALTLTKDVIIENKLGEKPIISAHDNLTWTKTSGMTNVYQVSRSAVNDVYDAKFVNKHGDYKELIKKNSIAEVNQTTGSWYTDGTITYVHSSNSRAADEYIRPMMNTNNGRVIGGGTYYFEGITFEGGNSAFRVENTESAPVTKFIAKKCKFKYTKLVNALTVLGAEVYLQSCEAAYAMQDGFNYHMSNGVKCKVIEVDCISRFNGKDGANQNNGSTNHDGGYTIRVNGDYHHNHGPNVIDVNDGAQTWNVGTAAHESIADGGISNSDFKNGNVGASKMWLDSCVSFGSEYSLVTQGEGSVSYENNNVFTEEIFNDNETLIESYTPVLSSIPLTYTEVRELRLIERRNYDSRTGTGWVEVTNTAHYTTGIGDTMTLEFEGTGVDFIAPLNQRGGIWEFRVDNNDPVIVSVHENVTEDKELITGVTYRVEIGRGLSEGRHILVATFKGADPDNPPSSGDARGYVTFNPGSVIYSAFDVYGY